MNLAELGDVADFINGAAFKPADWHEDGQRIIRIQNLNDPSKPYNRTTKSVPEKYQVPPGTLLVSWSASLGVFEWQEADTALLNQHIFKVVPQEDKVDQGYLKHILEGALVDMEKYHRGSTMKHVNRGEFLGTKIPLPPIDEQKRIAAILDQADAMRRLRQRAIDRLNTLGQAIFHEMFGDPSSNPMGWEMGTIRDLLIEAKYGTSKKANTEGEGIPVLRMGNITYDGALDLSDLKYVQLSEKELPKYTAKYGDILFNRTNSKELVGKTAVYDRAETMALAGYLVRARVNERGNPFYISAYMNSAHGKKTLRNMCKNIVGMANINAQEFQNISIAVPPVELQDKFANLIVQIGKKREPFQKAQQKDEALFASLQSKAFRGEL